MTERDFCYWLQGLFEVAKPEALTKDQTAMVREHLALVFTKVTGAAPKIPVATPEQIEEQAKTMDDFLKAVERSRKAIPIPRGRLCDHGISYC